MATSGVSEDKLLCAICLERLNRPRSLPCLHTFCTSCLRAHISMQIEYPGVRCPVCRVDIPSPKPYARRDEWVEHFPLNHWIQSVIDDQKDIRETEKTLYCVDHKDSKLALFCVDHDRLCCGICLIKSHKTCNNVREVEEKAKSTDLAAEKELIEDMVRELDKRSRDGKLKATEAQRKLENKKTALVDSLRKSVGSAISNIRRSERNIMAELDNIYGKDLAYISESTKHFEHDKTMCRETRAALESLDELKQRLLSFVKIQKAKETLLDHITTAVDTQIDLCKGGTMCQISLEMNPELRNIQSVDKIGRLRVEQDGNRKVLQRKLRDEDSTCTIVGDQVHYYKATSQSVKEFRVEHIAEEQSLHHVQTINTISDDSSTITWITCAIVFKGNVFMVCDSASSSLKFMKERDKIFEYRTPNCWGLAKISKDRVAVSLPSEHAIRLYDVKTDLNSSKVRVLPRIHETITTDGCCFGVCFTGAVMVAACEDSVQTYTPAGKHLDTLDGDGTEKGNFRRAIDVQYSEVLSTLYVCDEGRNCVLAFSMFGAGFKTPAKFVYANELLQMPQSLAIGLAGQIFVTGFRSMNIHVISHLGEILRVISLNQRPYAVAVDAERRLLFLSSYPSHGQNGLCSLYSMHGPS